jgi:hypothetical protein
MPYHSRTNYDVRHDVIFSILRYLFSLKSKYSSWHCVLKEPQYVVFPLGEIKTINKIIVILILFI